uniref:Putative secreted protein n=1 Tax=Ixodes ricinus TaxID=34613 RepID=A0A147BM18_IXORI
MSICMFFAIISQLTIYTLCYFMETISAIAHNQSSSFLFPLASAGVRYPIRCTKILNMASGIFTSLLNFLQ